MGERMKGALAVRDEVIEMVKCMPERNLYALRPLMEVLASEPEDREDALSDEEMEAFIQSRKRWEENPESFVSVDEYAESRGLQIK